MSRDQGSAIQFSEEFVGDAAAFCRACAAHELEGIVSKLANSRYRSGRSRTWLKTKCFAESELTLLGIDRDRKTGAQRALLAKSERGQLIYAGPAFIALRGEPREDFEARVAATTGLRDFAPNSASARGVRGISRERHSRHRKAHMHILFECRSKCVPTGNADQHWCSLSVGLPIGFAAAKIYAARLGRIRPRTQRLTVLEVQ